MPSLRKWPRDVDASGAVGSTVRSATMRILWARIASFNHNPGSNRQRPYPLRGCFLWEM